MLAQTDADQDLMSLSIEDLVRVKVFSASRHLEESRDAPSAVSVVTAEEIATYGWRTLADVLRSVRSFYTAYDRNYVYLGVRGLLRSGDYNSRILLLINGHRLNDNIYDSAFIGTEFPLDLDLVERIEIVRGPSSSLYGTNAVFGVVNVITKRPRGAVAVEAAGDSASFLARKGRLTLSLERGRASALLSGSLYRSDGQSELVYPEFATVATNNGRALDADGDGYAQAFADLRFANIRLQGLFGSRRKVIPTASFGTTFNDPGTRTTDTRGYVDVSYQREFTSRTELTLRAYYDRYRYQGTYAYGGADLSERVLNIDDAVADWAGIDVNVGRYIGRHRITVGTDYEHSFRVDQQNYDLGGAVHVSDSRRPWRTALYSEAELKLSPVLTVTAGGRIDYFRWFGGTASPRLAAIYLPNSRTSLKYIFGRAFRAPNPYQAYYSDGVALSANPELQPETVLSHELVLERTLTRRLSLSAGGFYNALSNLIDQAPDPATGLTHFVNVGRMTGRGLELELQAGRVSGLNARASYTITDAHDPLTGSRLNNAPLHLAKLNGRAPVLRQAVAGLELLYSGAQQSYKQSRISPWLLTNITFSTRTLRQHWEVSASCYNLFDRRWFSPAGPEHEQSAIEQDGRTYRFKLTYRFRVPRDGNHND
jgi:iron complex outermembrane receptor protein